jgi:hypothetical protein
MNTNSSKLTNAFKSLRKAGFIARQNFTCCGNCAGHALAGDVKGMTPSKRERVKGAVFYTRQDGTSVRGSNGRLRSPHHIYIGYGPVSVSGMGTFGVSETEIAGAVVAALKAAGLEAEWDGDPASKVLVNL